MNSGHLFFPHKAIPANPSENARDARIQSEWRFSPVGSSTAVSGPVGKRVHILRPDVSRSASHKKRAKPQSKSDLASVRGFVGERQKRQWTAKSEQKVVQCVRDLSRSVSDAMGLLNSRTTLLFHGIEMSFPLYNTSNRLSDTYWDKYNTVVIREG